MNDSDTPSSVNPHTSDREFAAAILEAIRHAPDETLHTKEDLVTSIGYTAPIGNERALAANLNHRLLLLGCDKTARFPSSYSSGELRRALTRHAAKN